VDKNLWIEQRTETFQEILDNAAQIAQSNGDQVVLDAARAIAQSMGLRLGMSLAKPRVDPRDSELERLRKQEQERTSNDHRQNYDSFRNSINEEYIETVTQEIETDLKAALAKANLADAGDSVLKRMVKDAYDRLDEKMNSQPDTRKRMSEAFQAAFRDRRMSASDRKGILDFVTRRARATRPAVVREVVEEWTKSILGANRKTIQTKQTVAATTKDVGTSTGAPPTTNGKPPSAATPGKPKTFESIMDNVRQQAGRPA
jgi:signal transduction histidine kinase